MNILDWVNDEIVRRALQSMTGAQAPSDPVTFLGQRFAESDLLPSTRVQSPLLSQLAFTPAQTPAPVPQAVSQEALPSPPPPTPAFPVMAKQNTPSNTAGVMGLSGTDWMKLIGALGGPLRIGTPEMIRRGGGFRPLAALGYGAQLYEQNQALEAEQSRQQALSQWIQRGNAAIANAPNPVEAERLAQQFRAGVSAFLPTTATARGGEDVFAGPSKEDRQRYEDQQAFESIARAKRLAADDGRPAEYTHLLDVASKSPEALKLLGNEQAQAQLRNEGILTGPAAYQSEQAATQLEALIKMLPPEMQRNMLVKITGKPTGVDVGLSEPTTEGEVLAARSREIPGREEAKAFVSPATSNKQMTDDQLFTKRNQLVDDVRQLQQQLMTERGPLGEIFGASAEDRKRIQWRLDRAAAIANDFHNKYADRLGLTRGDLFPDVAANESIRQATLQELIQQYTASHNGKKPSMAELRRLYLQGDTGSSEPR